MELVLSIPSRGTIALGTMRPRHISLLSSFPSSRTLILSICLSFSDSMQSSCFGNILVRIHGTAESEAIRPPSPPRLVDAIFTCGGGEEITVKAREFAFVEISRIPADTTPLFPSAPHPDLSHSHLYRLSLPVSDTICTSSRPRIFSSDLKYPSKTRKCLSYVSFFYILTLFSQISSLTLRICFRSFL